MEVSEFRKKFPAYYKNVKEIDELCKGYKKLGDIFVGCVNQFIANIFLTEDASLDFIKETELLWKITPDDTLTKSERIAQIKAKFNDKVPYTIQRLYILLSSILGDKYYKVTEQYNAQNVDIKIEGTESEEVVEVIKKMARKIIPAQITITISMIFATWRQVKTKYSTWRDILNTGKTWKQIKKGE